MLCFNTFPRWCWGVQKLEKASSGFVTTAAVAAAAGEADMPTK